jgi:hypothetical protein
MAQQGNFLCAPLRCAPTFGREENLSLFFFPALRLQRALRASDTYRAIFIRPAIAGLELCRFKAG